jgi:hypothetical protein
VRTGAAVLEAIRDGEGELERAVSTCLLHMVPRDRDAVVLGHVPRRVGENGRNDAHGRGRRVDKRVADHKLFQNVVLDRALKLSLFGTLCVCAYVRIYMCVCMCV